MFIYRNNKNERIFISAVGKRLNNHIQTGPLYLFTDLENSPVKLDSNIIDQNLLKIPTNMTMCEITSNNLYNYNNVKVIDDSEPKPKSRPEQRPELILELKNQYPVFMPKCKCTSTMSQFTFCLNGYVCDRCSKHINKFERGSRCVMCDFDLCLSCTHFYKYEPYISPVVYDFKL